MRYLYIILFFILQTPAFCQYYGESQGASGVPGTVKRSPLNTVSRAIVTGGTRQGFTVLTDANGNLRFADFPAIEATPIVFEPTATGNTSFLSSFVVAPSGDTYYIDWQGKAIKLESGTGTGTSDADWYTTPGTTPPATNNTHAYRTGAATIGEELNEGNGIELTISDPGPANTTRGALSLRSTQKGHIHFKKTTDGHFNAIEGNGNLYFYNDQTAGTSGGIVAFVETTQANEYTPSSSQAHVVFDYDNNNVILTDYPNTRNDAGTPQNLLTTTSTGVVNSHPVTELLSGVTSYGEFDNDYHAAANGVPIGGTYEASITNTMGLTHGDLKKRKL